MIKVFQFHEHSVIFFIVLTVLVSSAFLACVTHGVGLNVKYWTLTNGCIIHCSECQSLSVRDTGLPL